MHEIVVENMKKAKSMNLTIEEVPNKQKKKMTVITSSLIQMGILLMLSLIGIFIILFVLFILIRNMPGNPYLWELGANPTVSQIEAYNLLDEQWGFDKPLISQFFMFYWNSISGNWGESLIIRRGYPVNELIAERMPRFLELNFLSFGFSLLLGAIFGILAYKFKEKWYGLIPQAIKRLNWAIGLFGLGMGLQYLIGYKFGLLPPTMYYDPILDPVSPITNFRLLDCLLAGDSVAFWDTVQHLIMPIFCLSFIMFSFITDLTYSIIDFYKSPKKVHLLFGKIAFYLGFIFLFSILIEIIFNLNGIGTLIFYALLSIDVNVLMGAFYSLLLTFIIINMSINFLLHIIRIIIELVKKSKLDKNGSESTINFEPLISESITNSPKTVSEPILEEIDLIIDKKDVNKKSIRKEIYLGLRRKIFNPLTILGIILIGFILILAIFAAKLSPYEYELVQGIDFSVSWYEPPSSDHIFGVTKFGRDVYSRCLYGIQTTVKVGFIATLIGMPLGVLLGIISSFFGKWAKYVIDIINGLMFFFPGIIFATSIILIDGNELSNFYWILGLVALPFATLFSQQAVSYEMKKGNIKPLQFNKINGRKILLRLPNIILSILGVGCLIIGFTILIFETLAFFGMGDPIDIILGTDINIGRSRLATAPWASLWPAFWIYITVLGFMMLGIGLKEE
ncbi:MAG: ABC transporter permease subunit [Promethearchaeota archaeon]